MAESVVAFFLDKLSELITRKANLLAGVDEQINSLRNELQLIRSFLKDADARRKESERTRVWLNQVRDVTYDAEDVIDEFILQIERQQRWTVGVIGSLKSCLRSTNHLKTRHDVGVRLEQIKGRVAEIFANKSKYGIELLQLGEASTSTNQGLSWKPRRSPMVEEVDVVGIEDDSKMIVRQLTQGEMQHRVISIVGMGGLGKTTLAKKVYNSIDVTRHFDYRAWVSLSQEYRFREVLMEIIKQVRVLGEKDEKKLKKKDDDEVWQELFQYLKGRKYLVVIDDIWSIDAWDNLETIFPEEANGSRVMLTTRKKEVALHSKSIAHEMRFLKEEECWELFRKKLLSKNVTDVFLAELEDIGRKIVAKCGGLPLAVIVLGGFLSRKNQIRSEWEKVLKGINWQLDEGQNQISKILSLSYNDLPHFLKSCFLYFGVFPEDYEIPAKKLIQLWVAEGFVQQRGDGTMEEVAEDYLEELISRSMVQVSKRRYNGCIKICRVHDLLRDLSISEAKENKFLELRYQSAEFASPVRARRQTIHGRIDLSFHYHCPQLRSLLYFGPPLDWRIFGKENWKIPLGGFKLLRVLDLANMNLEKFPAEISKMIHLRYLGLAGRCLTRIPSSVSNLVNLRTLKGNATVRSLVSTLPSNIGMMDQLRHIYFNSFRIDKPFRIECLINLQTLSRIEAGDWIEDGLARLTNLRKLGVCEVLNSQKEALVTSILKLDGLRHLYLGLASCNVYMPTFSNHIHLHKLKLYGRLEKLLEPREFPPNIMYLYLEQSRLKHDPLATLVKLPHLKILKLRNAFDGRKMVCSVQGFPQLEKLELSHLYFLEEWKVQEGALSSLRRLEISHCSELKMLPEGLQHVTTLQELRLDKLSKELKDRILVENGGDWRKIRHVPSLIIDRERIVKRSI